MFLETKVRDGHLEVDQFWEEDFSVGVKKKKRNV